MRISPTKGLLLILLVAVVFAAWSWLRPYEWRPDPGARCRIVGVELTRDHANHWLQVHLRPAGPQSHDWRKPVRLVADGGRELEPADTRMTGSPEHGITDLWFKFWLENGDLAGPLRLRVNDGMLTVKAKPGEPALGLSGRKYFSSNRW